MVASIGFSIESAVHRHPGIPIPQPLWLYSEGEYDVFHTISRCVAFERKRDVLIQWIERFKLCDLVFRKLKSSDAVIAMIRFAESVLTTKVVAKHERQASQVIAQSRGAGSWRSTPVRDPMAIFFFF